MSTQRQQVAQSGDKRQQRAEAWLDQAIADNEALGTLLSVGRFQSDHQIRHPGQTVYLLQQSVEKAVKALMVADGEDERALLRKPFVHDSLTIVLTFIERILTIPAYANAVDPLLETVSEDFESTTEVFEYLEYAKGLVKETLEKELAVAPPGQVREIVNWMQRSRRDSVSSVRASLPSQFQVDADLGADGSGSFVDGMMRSLCSVFRNETIPAGHRTASRKSVAGFLGEAAPWLFQGPRHDGPQTITLDRDATVSKLVWQGWALPHLMFLAALTFPHSTTSRYPAPTGAPDDPRDAAKCGMMGAQHYSRALGVVDQIRELNEQTRIVLEDLRPFLRGTYMVREATFDNERCPIRGPSHRELK